MPLVGMEDTLWWVHVDMLTYVPTTDVMSITIRPPLSRPWLAGVEIPRRSDDKHGGPLDDDHDV